MRNAECGVRNANAEFEFEIASMTAESAAPADAAMQYFQSAFRIPQSAIRNVLLVSRQRHHHCASADSKDRICDINDRA